MRFTVAKKIVIGLAVIALIGIAAKLLMYRGLYLVERDMQRLAHVEEPLILAAYEMEINMNGVALAVLKYVSTRTARYRGWAEKDLADFDGFHATYSKLIASPAERALNDTVTRLYTEFKPLALNMMQRADQQDALFEKVATEIEEIDELIHKELKPGIDLMPTLTQTKFDKATAAANMEAEIAELGFWAANYQRVHKPEYKTFIGQKIDYFGTVLTRFESYDLSAEERRIAARLREIFNDVTASIARVVALEDSMVEQRDKFISLRVEMDDIFDDRMQPLALRNLTAPRIRAEATALNALRTISLLIPLYLLCAIVVGALLLGFIMRPLGRLMKGTRVIGKGDLSYRIATPGSDEFSDLAREFNRMVGQLQETTVSKNALQASETRLSETVVELRHEISERERAEQERAKLQAALRRAETMSAMGVLVSGVAHEVRNPLFGISSTLDAMDARLKKGGDHRRHMAVLHGEVDRLSKLMRDLLAYGRPTEPNFHPESIAASIAQAASACLPLAERAGVEIVNHAELDCAVRMDRERLSQVFQNLLENAIHHAPAGSTVVIESAVSSEVGERGERWVECSIADQGPGFRPEDLPHIFEPFFTRRPGGTGLGLGIARRIAEDHFGTVAVRNQTPPAAGAIVTVRLPIHVEAQSGKKAPLGV